MDIRDIRIDRFQCWQQVAIASLRSGLNVIHLQDGGRPADFLRFLHGMLFGFPMSNDQAELGGSLVVEADGSTWELHRFHQRDGQRRRQLWRDGQLQRRPLASLPKLRAGLPADLAALLLIPRSTASSFRARWKQLEQNSAARAWLGLDHVNHPWLQASKQTSLASHGRVIEELAEQREFLITAVRQARRAARAGERSQPTSNGFHASTTQHELERLQLQLLKIETRLRQAIRISQVGAVIRSAASKLPTRTRNPFDTEGLRRLTGEVCTALAMSSAGRIQLQTADGDWTFASEYEDEGILQQAWLATRLEIARRASASGETVPLVILANEILGTEEYRSLSWRMLRDVSQSGQQILLVTEHAPWADHLGQHGYPVVCIGRRLVPLPPGKPEQQVPKVDQDRPLPTAPNRHPVQPVTYEVSAVEFPNGDRPAPSNGQPMARVAATVSAAARTATSIAYEQVPTDPRFVVGVPTSDVGLTKKDSGADRDAEPEQIAEPAAADTDNPREEDLPEWWPD